jgi:hypothetical protein
MQIRERKEKRKEKCAYWEGGEIFFCDYVSIFVCFFLLFTETPEPRNWLVQREECIYLSSFSSYNIRLALGWTNPLKGRAGPRGLALGSGLSIKGMRT